MQWRLLDDGPLHPYYNMALEEAVLKQHKEGVVPPTVRFYEWTPPGLSLGYFQKIVEEIDHFRCREQNIIPVRRLTGGRTILHDREITYSIIVRKDLNFLPEGIVPSYRKISRGIVRALRDLGIKVAVKKMSGDSDSGFSSACFDAPSRYEVVAGGRKLVGSAQTRKEGVILQHGSIPIKIDSDLLYSLLKYEEPRRRRIEKYRFEKKATDLSTESDREIKTDKIKQNLVAEWENEFEVKISSGKLTPEEKTLAHRLKQEKYSSKEWNHKY